MRKRRARVKMGREREEREDMQNERRDEREKREEGERERITNNECERRYKGRAGGKQHCERANER